MMSEEKTIEEQVEEKLDAMSIQEKFDAAKQIECEILDAKVILCDRIDTYIDLRNIYRDYYDKVPTYDTVMHYVELCKYICMKMREIAGNFEIDDFLKDEMEDPYQSLTRTIPDCEDEDECFEAMIRFNFIRPFAERALHLPQLVKQDVEELVEEDA